MLTKHPLLPLFEKFIRDSQTGKRLNKNGSRIQQQSIENYKYCKKLLEEFIQEKRFPVEVYQIRGNNKRQHNAFKKYYSNFYRLFTSFLYKEKNCYDNYVGQTIKHIRTFYGWLNNDQGILTGPYYKKFYVTNEDIPIVTLSVKQLQFLAFDKSFEETLSESLKRSKDIFVFGCIVGLRFSDLRLIKATNIEYRDSHYYLKVRSKKTGIDTFVKLPEPAIEIINKYNTEKEVIFSNTMATKRKYTKRTLLPSVSLDWFNTTIKKIAELAGWTELIQKTKTKSGQTKEKNQSALDTRFCDALSSHTMRRTSITTMLTSGMPEYIVRKISGHTNDSKAFYRYVNLAQSLMDKEIEKMHKNLEIAV